jgi:hypothetical protein
MRAFEHIELDAGIIAGQPLSFSNRDMFRMMADGGSALANAIYHPEFC